MPVAFVKGIDGRISTSDFPFEIIVCFHRAKVYLRLFEQLKMKVKPVFINCMTLKKSQDIFKKIVAELGNKSCKPGKECLQYLEKTFSATGPMMYVHCFHPSLLLF